VSPLPRKILMTVDAVGGVWRYAMDLGSSLHGAGTDVIFACLGPAPSSSQLREAEAIGVIVVVDMPLDWMVAGAAELRRVPDIIGDLATRSGADLLHLNLPSQAAGLDVDVPTLVVSHSCVVTWFRAVRGSDVPADWHWQRALNQYGFDAADAVVSPSQSHADLLAGSYRGLGEISVVHNATRPLHRAAEREAVVIAAGRWWDEGKNGRTLDLAARDCQWPIKMAGSQQGPNGQFQRIEHAVAVGEVSAAEVRNLMGRAEAFVSPSIYEPFGLAPLEAARPACPWCFPTSPPIANCGAARPYSHHPVVRRLSPKRSTRSLRRPFCVPVSASVPPSAPPASPFRVSSTGCGPPMRAPCAAGSLQSSGPLHEVRVLHQLPRVRLEPRQRALPAWSDA